MGNIINTAPCRFCGQMVQIDSEEKLTQPQAEEQATMSCTCEQAVEYQKEKQRKEKKRRCRTSLHCSERQQHRKRDAVRAS